MYSTKLKLFGPWAFVCWLAIFALMMGTNCVLEPKDQQSSIFAGSGNEAGNNSVAYIGNDAIIDLPSSLAKTSGASRKVSRTADKDPVEITRELYDAVRGYVGFADELVNGEFGVKNIILTWRDSIDWKHVQSVGSVDYEDPNIKLHAAYDAGTELHYQLILYNPNHSKTEKALQVDFNGDFETPKGIVYYYLDALDPAEHTNNTKILVSFFKNDSMRTLDIDVTMNAPTGEDDAQHLRYKAIEKEGIVHVSGGSYHPNMDSILVDTVGHCYIFKAKADTVKNKAVVSLGLPPADFPGAGNEIFTTYGIGDLFANRILREIKTSADTGFQMLIVKSYKDSMSIDSIFAKLDSTKTPSILERWNFWKSLPDPSEIQNMTIEDLKYFLELNKNISDAKARRDFQQFMVVMNLEQPVYFDENGYAGNGDVMPSSDYLGLTLSDFGLSTLIPLEVKNLQITY